MALPVVHLITDRRLARELPARLELALAGLPPGLAAVHLREKDLCGAALFELARRLLSVVREHGQRLVINDRADVALAAGADGVHLPSAGLPPEAARGLLGPSALVGVSCHSADDLRRARDAGASFATFGPVWDTPSKRRFGAPVGLSALAAGVTLGLPLVALGGVTPDNSRLAREAGAAGVGVIRAWLEGPDPAAVVRRLAGLAP